MSLVSTIKELQDVFTTTTVLDTKNLYYKEFRDNRYKGGYITSKIPDKNKMGFHRNNSYRGDDWSKMNKLCDETNAVSGDADVYLTRCLWYQLNRVLKEDAEYTNHPLYKNYHRIQMAKKATIITLSAAALTTAVYAALWYKGRGTSLPGMNRLFAPAFTKIATQTVDPALQKVASFFGKTIIDKSSEIATVNPLDAALMIGKPTL